MRKMVFLDTETTGLDDDLDEPWEIGYIIRDLQRGRDTEGSILVEHDTERAKSLPAEFYADYCRRYDPVSAVSRAHATRLLQGVFDVAGDGPRPTLVGCVPSFDTLRLGRMMRQNGAVSAWHYHIQDVESVALGWISAKLAWDSRLDPNRRQELQTLVDGLAVAGRSPRNEDLGRALGIDPANYDRHTGLGDCRYARDMWDAMFWRSRARETTDPNATVVLTSVARRPVAFGFCVECDAGPGGLHNLGCSRNLEIS